MSHGAVHGAGVYATDDLRMAFSHGDCIAIIELLEDTIQWKKTPNIYIWLRN